MLKTEFLQELQDALRGEVSPAVIQENLRYYDTYIFQETAKGRNEAEVIEELGGPRIIARTIIDSQGGSQGDSSFYETEERYSGDYGQTRSRSFSVDLSKWYGKLLLIVLAILILGVVILVVTGLLYLAVWILVPLLAVSLVAWLIRSIFRR